MNNLAPQKKSPEWLDGFLFLFLFSWHPRNDGRVAFGPSMTVHPSDCVWSLLSASTIRALSRLANIIIYARP